MTSREETAKLMEAVKLNILRELSQASTIRHHLVARGQDFGNRPSLSTSQIHQKFDAKGINSENLLREMVNEGRVEFAYEEGHETRNSPKFYYITQEGRNSLSAAQSGKTPEKPQTGHRPDDTPPPRGTPGTRSK